MIEAHDRTSSIVKTNIRTGQLHPPIQNPSGRSPKPPDSEQSTELATELTRELTEAQLDPLATDLLSGEAPSRLGQEQLAGSKLRNFTWMDTDPAEAAGLGGRNSRPAGFDDGLWASIEQGNDSSYDDPLWVGSGWMPSPSLQALWMPPPPGVELKTWRRLARMQAANFAGERGPLHDGFGDQRVPAVSWLVADAPAASPGLGTDGGPAAADNFSLSDGEEDASDAERVTQVKTSVSVFQPPPPKDFLPAFRRLGTDGSSALRKSMRSSIGCRQQ